ncbi:MAG: twin-arginine translocation pathway signal [Rhodobacterales bacterium]
MHIPIYNRRSFLVTSGAVLACSALGAAGPAIAQGIAPTQSMRGGSNNYRPGAPLVEKLGNGFFVRGRVLRASDGAALKNVRIQIWAATTLGGEREPANHGSVLTRADGSYELEMEQIVPNFGQPHAHLAYDDRDFRQVFLRPVMPSAADRSVNADFVLVAA